MPLAIIGQAPSRQGPGRAFSGPSGNRLCRLLGVEDYLDLYRVAHLENLLTKPMEKHPNGRGDIFLMDEAQVQAKISMDVMLFLNRNTQVIACGHKVYRAFTRRKGQYFKGARIVTKTYNPPHTLDVWCFPHPSGASPYWNERENFDRAAEFIRSVRDRAARFDAQ